MALESKSDRNVDVLRAARLDHELMAEIHYAQLESIVSRVKSAAVGALIFSAVMAAYLYDSIGTAVWYWFAIKTVVTAWRLALTYLWDKRKARSPAFDKWLQWIRISLFVDGLVLGSIGYLTIKSGAPDVDMFWTSAVLFGVTAVAMTTLESDWISGFLYAMPIVGQTILYLLIRDSPFGSSTALGSLIYAVVLLSNARKAARDEEQRIVQSRAILKYQKQNELALEVARNESRIRTEMVSSITHELRTPIHGILALSHQIAKDPHAASTPKAAEMIIKSGEHLVGLVNDVLDFGRLEAAGVTLRPEVFDLNDLVDELENLGYIIGREKGVRFEVLNALARPYHVHADPSRLKQIALNLISNGIKFTSKGGLVSMRLHDPDGRGSLTLEVTDTGMGIAAENLASIFEPFSKHARSQSEGGLGGSGLGLSISRRLAAAMKGSLEVRSELGKGSTFTLRLRIEKVIVSLHGKNQEQEDIRPIVLKGHVVIAEDHNITAELARATLEMHGMTVSVVGTGDLAIYAATMVSPRPDIVLMDGDMPGLDGLTSTRRIREFEQQSRSGRIPIVIISGRCSSEDIAQAKAAGADDYLGKPYSNKELAGVVARNLYLDPPSLQSGAA